jgi:hypothetical protein
MINLSHSSWKTLAITIRKNPQGMLQALLTWIHPGGESLTGQIQDHLEAEMSKNKSRSEQRFQPSEQSH